MPKKYKSYQTNVPIDRTSSSRKKLVRESRKIETNKNKFDASVKYIANNMGGGFHGSPLLIILFSATLLSAYNANPLGNSKTSEEKRFSRKNGVDSYKASIGNKVCKKDNKVPFSNAIASGTNILFSPNNQRNIENKKKKIEKRKEIQNIVNSIPIITDTNVPEKHSQTLRKWLEHSFVEIVENNTILKAVVGLIKLSDTFSAVITPQVYGVSYDGQKNHLLINPSIFDIKNKTIASKAVLGIIPHELAHVYTADSNELVFGGTRKYKDMFYPVIHPTKGPFVNNEKLLQDLRSLIKIYFTGMGKIGDFITLHKQNESGEKSHSSEEMKRLNRFKQAVNHYKPIITSIPCTEKQFNDKPAVFQTPEFMDYLSGSQFPSFNVYTHEFYKTGKGFYALVSAVENPFDNQIETKITAFVRDIKMRNYKFNDNLRSQILRGKGKFTSDEMQSLLILNGATEFDADTHILPLAIQNIFYPEFIQYHQERTQKTEAYIKNNSEIQTVSVSADGQTLRY